MILLLIIQKPILSSLHNIEMTTVNLRYGSIDKKDEFEKFEKGTETKLPTS